MTTFDVIVIETASLGDRAYIAHDGAVAIVIDPPRDIDRIETELDTRQLTLELILETHVHNDYVSGGLTLSRITDAEYGHAEAEELHFDHHPLADGDRLDVGTMEVEVVGTPGHTEHHLSYVIRVPHHPPAAFTGGSLLYGTVGRTDLVAGELTDELTRRQHRSVRALAEMLPDDAQIYPTHGFGSFCASARSDDDSDGTLGTDEIHEAQRQMVRIGIDRPAGAAAGGIEHWGVGAGHRNYPVSKFADLASMGDTVTVLDVRRADEYDSSHIAGAVNIALNELIGRIQHIPDGSLWVHCASGFRASIAASILDRAGRSVTLIDDDFDNASDSGRELTGSSAEP